MDVWLFQEKIDKASVYLDCDDWKRMYNIIDKTALSHDFEIEKNHGLCDKADKDYSLRVLCVQIRNYDLCVWLYLIHDSYRSVYT